MMRISAATAMVGVLAAQAGIAAPAAADNLLGIYAGASIGESTVRSDDGYAPGYGYYDHDHHTGWKAVAGIRPLSIAGAELEYVDFGHPGSDSGYYDYDSDYGPDSHPRAIAAFAVGYMPLPLPFLDVYGKLGAARLHTNVDGFDEPDCFSRHHCPAPGGIASQSVWDTRLAYGAGIQYRFFGLSVRAEYERISSPFGDPDLFSVGAAWTF